MSCTFDWVQSMRNHRPARSASLANRAMDIVRPMKPFARPAASKARLQPVEPGFRCRFLDAAVRQMPHAPFMLLAVLVDKVLERCCGQILRAGVPSIEDAFRHVVATIFGIRGHRQALVASIAAPLRLNSDRDFKEQRPPVGKSSSHAPRGSTFARTVRIVATR